jgi:hypothetical protein
VNNSTHSAQITGVFKPFLLLSDTISNVLGEISGSCSSGRFYVCAFLLIAQTPHDFATSFIVQEGTAVM